MKKRILYPREGGRSKWVKVLTHVDEEAVNCYGFHGTFHTPGSLVGDPRAGTVVLERVQSGNRTIHNLYRLDEAGDWDLLTSSDSPGWAVEMSDEARAALEGDV